MKLQFKSALNPFLLFAIALAIGTAFLIGPLVHHLPPVINLPRYPRAAAPVTVQPLPAVQAHPAPDPVALRAEIEAAERSAHERQTALGAAQADLEDARRRVDALRAELAALEAKRAGMPIRPSTSVQPEIEHLNTVVEERREEVHRLENDLQDAKATLVANPTKPVDLARAVAPVKKLPKLVELLENRITPVTPRYFRFPFIALEPVFVVKRTEIGDTIAEAKQPDSDFARFLSKVKPKKEYLTCLLNPDSFEAFYAVRELAAKFGVETGWEPADTRSGRITIVSVKLGLSSDKNAVRLPEVMR